MSERSKNRKMFGLVNPIRELHSLSVRSLVARVEAKDGPLWDVKVNDVAVGTIPDADYASIRLGVLCNVRIYVAQAMNLLRVAVNVLEGSILAIGRGILWIGVCLVVFSPETISSVLSALEGATADDVRHAVSMAAPVIIMAISVGNAVSQSRFGFIDRFDEATGNAIRKYCSVAAEGSIVLSSCAWMSSHRSIPLQN